MSGFAGFAGGDDVIVEEGENMEFSGQMTPAVALAKVPSLNALGSSSSRSSPSRAVVPSPLEPSVFRLQLFETPSGEAKEVSEDLLAEPIQPQPQDSQEPHEEVVSVAPAASASAVREETDQERIARETRESEAYVWELMRAEAQAAHDAQMEFMRANAHLLSPEDLAALQQAVNESVDPALLAPALGGRGGDDDQAADGEGEDGEEGDEEEEDDDDAAWNDPNNYDRLLALGDQIGDVKKDKWRAGADAIIAGFARMKYTEIIALYEATTAKAAAGNAVSSPGSAVAAPSSGSPSSSSPPYPDKRHRPPHAQAHSTVTSIRFHDKRCAVCMDSFESPDPETGAEPELCVLPCTHYFHPDCATGWVRHNNSCPGCKSKIVASPPSAPSASSVSSASAST